MNGYNAVSIFDAPYEPQDMAEIFYAPFVQDVPANVYVPAQGDWVQVYIPRLGVEHEGIITGISSYGNGVFRGTVAHNMKGAGVVITDAFAFSEGNPIKFHLRAQSDAHVNAIMTRVNGSVGKPYHLTMQNCQHFASFAFNGKAESPSVKGVGLLAAGLAVFALFGLE